MVVGSNSARVAIVDQQALVEYRYRAVREVLAGSPIGEVAARYGTSRQSVHTWRQRFQQEGMPGLADRSRRPRTSPTRLSAEIEALICEMRRRHPRWGAQRIAHELGACDLERVPGQATVHRVLARNGLVTAQQQEHKRTWRRWQREAPMQLWQLDLVGGVPLADGRECKLVTGIDDHSRFVVIAAVVAVPSGRAVCAAFTAAMRRYGVPFEVLSDNGKQFTGQHIRPQPVEVLFERVCRENGIMQRLTKPRSPTTTGKIERFHKTLRQELLDHVAPFESPDAAQEAIDAWVHTYNHARPHQALNMATPASVFRPHGPTRDDALSAASAEPHPEPTPAPQPMMIEVAEPPVAPSPAAAVEFDIRVPPSGELSLVPGKQRVGVSQGLAGRTLTIWADLRSIHLLLEGHLVRTVASRLLPEDLAYLAMRGARPAGAEPATAALPRLNGRPVLAAGQAVEVDRKVHRDGHVLIAGIKCQVAFALAGRSVTLRLDGHLMHAIADGALVGTWPCPISTDRLTSLAGARAASAPLPPPPLPAGSIRAQRRVHASGRIMVAKQAIKLGSRHAGKLVTVVIEDTHFRILHGEEEIAVRPRKDLTPITRLYVRGVNTQPS
ncbi:IS481 family transposase [Streptosporangium lutulentum]|uniref:Transposase InsO family protein n=1 Tax=Streptosporangium lutulentum TaxID=1461250 RepID=A0ABT9QJS5_9ACTN|nr:IS481 family transposase [Streptosporangium lutulentum]MDP9847003.1 transposase InsO family protein [Streptosporangium lutulentum]